MISPVTYPNVVNGDATEFPNKTLTQTTKAIDTCIFTVYSGQM